MWYIKPRMPHCQNVLHLSLKEPIKRFTRLTSRSFGPRELFPGAVGEVIDDSEHPPPPPPPPHLAHLAHHPQGFLAMATSFRPSILRQVAAAAAPAKRAYSTPTVRSQFNAQTRPTWTAQRAAFQTSARRPILPPLPQVINGNVNEPARVPEPHPSHGSYHWTMERWAMHSNMTFGGNIG